MNRPLPDAANLEQLRKQAKDLARAVHDGDLTAAERIHAHLPRARTLTLEEIIASSFTLVEAQFVIAREYGFPSWTRLKAHVEVLTAEEKSAMAAFEAAVRAEDAAALRQLLLRHAHLRADIDAPIFSFDTPAIVVAAAHKSMSILETLLDFGADPNVRSGWWAGGFSPLVTADPETAAYLISRGAVMDIHDAAHLDRLDRVRELLAEDPSRVNARGGDGQSPLHFARSVEMATLLVESGADLNLRDLDHGSTPAQTTVTDRPEVCRYLLEHGAEPDIFMAVQLGDIDLTRRLLDIDPSAIQAKVGEPPFTSGDSNGGHIYTYHLASGESSLYLAAALGHTEIWSLLMERAAPPQRLMSALFAGAEQIAREILEQNPGIVDRLSATEHRVVPDCAWRNRIGSVRLALEIGFPVDAIGDEESTALNRAAVRGYADIVALTLKHGADPGMKNRYGGTCLRAGFWGCVNFRDPRGDYAETTRLLLNTDRPWREIDYPLGNAAVDAVIREYLEAHSGAGLCAAILLNDEGAVRARLAAGADPDLPERADDISPRELAAREGRASLLEYRP